MDSIPLDDTAPQTTFIYVLIDPTTNEVRYVGKANDPHWRLIQHISKIKHEPTHKAHWLASLKSRGLQPVMQILEEVPFDLWEERELYWITYLLDQGHDLTNTYFGRAGAGMMPSETREKISLATYGRKKSPQMKTRLASSKKGTRLSPETIAKRSAARRGKRQSPETIARKIAAQTGKKRSPETRAKMTLAWERRRTMKKASSQNLSLWD